MRIGIELYRNQEDFRQGLQLDVACVMSRLYAEFPSIWFEEEYFQAQVERIKNLPYGASEKSYALRIAVSDTEERGPGFRFLVDSSNGEPLRGSLSRYGLSFLLDDGVEEELRSKASHFINSFCIHRIDDNDNSSAPLAM